MNVSSVWVLRVGESLVAVEPSGFKEVLEVSRPAPVPLAPAALVGLLGHQGSVIPLFDLGPLLGCAAAGSGLAALVETEGRAFAFLVDEVVGLKAGLSDYDFSTADHPQLKARLELPPQQALVLDLAKLLQGLGSSFDQNRADPVRA